MQELEAIRQLLETPKTIFITTHQNPDADAMGSSLGWAGYLRKCGHRVTVVTPTDYPDNLKWMSGNADVRIFDDSSRVAVKQLLDEADLIFCLDFSALNRIRDLEPLVRQARGRKILIDHHLEPEGFADVMFWDSKAAATAELIYRLIDQLGDAGQIDIPIAECLYAGIMTDTGSFRHGSTTPAVHQVAAALLETGMEVNRVHRRIFDNVSPDKLRFLGYVLAEKMVVLPEYRTAYITITAEELKRFRSKSGDTEGMVNYALSVEGVVMAVILIDRGDEIKLSFRSVGDFSVRDLAGAYFSGGGHRNASGGRSNLSLGDTLQRLLDVLPEFQTQLLETN